MKRHQTIMSLVTIFSLLMFVSVSWLNQAASSAIPNLTDVDTDELSFDSSIYPTYLAEVKEKTHSLGACNASSKDVAFTLGPKRFLESLLPESRISECNSPCSLWLLHRSLLI
ncbi:hypothetical protein KF707_20905 [Candidatus Obscuribacterales bacterium]|nr:hypothetical protein [Candidatus Obscuribacterales bacterium]MBX3138702.1 hypothetical protein [Candidatus Obscuribacterales bacterium]MBX3151444.1 hypothetical protein [Candidatus Obscuribacterales bacterium]